MIFEDLDKQMRVYEESLDQILLPEIYMVARLDGRGFTRLTKEVCRFDAPFDIRFRDLMVDTVKELMNCGFRVVYGFTESDEISLLFHPEEDTFGRKIRKYNSILAGEASASFSHRLGQAGVFDCRMVPLPTVQRVKDYFLWRQEDAHRNALNSWCYWTLRDDGESVSSATKTLEGKSVSFKNELLFQHGINFDKLPSWQKRGIGLWFETYEKQGYNPKTHQNVLTTRREIRVEYELPLREAYAVLVAGFLAGNKIPDPKS